MKKYFSLAGITAILLLAFILYDYKHFYDGKLHVVFCDVGQGDAILIRTPSGRNLIVDGGPDKSLLACLSEYMPFWERRIDQVLLTHPHDDHFAGLFFLLDRYEVGGVDTIDLINKTRGYGALVDAISEKGIPTKEVFAGDKYQLKDGFQLRVLGPKSAYISQTSPGGTIGETGEFASLIAKLSYKEFDILLTGDSQVSGLNQVKNEDLKGVEVLQVPHHGSRTGFDMVMIRKISPKVAIISVGENKYGHPSGEILEILRNKDIKILRTDEMGDIEIVSDGKGWEVRN